MLLLLGQTFTWQKLRTNSGLCFVFWWWFGLFSPKETGIYDSE